MFWFFPHTLSHCQTNTHTHLLQHFAYFAITFPPPPGQVNLFCVRQRTDLLFFQLLANFDYPNTGTATLTRFLRFSNTKIEFPAPLLNLLLYDYDEQLAAEGWPGLPDWWRKWQPQFK